MKAKSSLTIGETVRRAAIVAAPGVTALALNARAPTPTSPREQAAMSLALIKAGQVGLVGGIHDLAAGQVKFLPN